MKKYRNSTVTVNNSDEAGTIRCDQLDGRYHGVSYDYNVNHIGIQ